MAVAADFLSLVVAVAAEPPVPVSPGWTPAATMGAIQSALLALGGGTGLKIFASHLIAMRRIADARSKQVDERGDAQNVALTARVTELEKALSDERRECDKQLAEMRGELREMQTKIDGFVRQLIAFQTSEARALPLSPAITRAVEAVDRIQGEKE